MDNVQTMPTAMLLENFRSLCRGIGATRNQEDNKRLSAQADMYEQEILRRAAW